MQRFYISFNVSFEILAEDRDKAERIADEARDAAEACLATKLCPLEHRNLVIHPRAVGELL